LPLAAPIINFRRAASKAAAAKFEAETGEEVIRRTGGVDRRSGLNGPQDDR
jgi:hypothetical protein